MYKIRPISANCHEILKKIFDFIRKMLDKSACPAYTMFRKAKDLVPLEVQAFGPLNRYIVWAGKPAQESAPEQIGEGRVPALADPARGRSNPLQGSPGLRPPAQKRVRSRTPDA